MASSCLTPIREDSRQQCPMQVPRSSAFVGADFKLWTSLPMIIKTTARCDFKDSATPTLRQRIKFTSSDLLTSNGLFLTVRDVLEFVAAAKASKQSAFSLLQGAGFLQDFKLAHFLFRYKSEHDKFCKLRKAHNARCSREGSHQADSINKQLDKPFFNKAQIHVKDVSGQPAPLIVPSCSLSSPAHSPSPSSPSPPSLPSTTTSNASAVTQESPPKMTPARESGCQVSSPHSCSLSSPAHSPSPSSPSPPSLPSTTTSNASAVTQESPPKMTPARESGCQVSSPHSCSLSSPAHSPSPSSPSPPSLPSTTTSNASAVTQESPPKMTPAREFGCQVSSPQIKTDSQLKRRERGMRRKIDFTEAELGRKSRTICTLNDRLKDSCRETIDKRNRLVEARLESKQLKEDVKKMSATIISARQKVAKSARDGHHLAELVERNDDLQHRVLHLERQLGQKEVERRRMMKAYSKAKRASSSVAESLDRFCHLVKEGGVAEAVDSLRAEQSCSSIVNQLSEALTAPVKTKEGSFYKDRIALLTMDLQNMGVPQGSVSKVIATCTDNISGRTLDALPSRRTAGRMIRRGGILSDLQVATSLSKAADKGIRVGQDTTTRRGTEHVSTVWAVRQEDGSVKYLQSRVNWLPNHTAETQAKHIEGLLSSYTTLLEKSAFTPKQRLSVAYVTEFIGDHVNDKLHRLLEADHIRILDELQKDEEISPEVQQRLRFLHKSACQLHSAAKASRAFFDGMMSKEPAGLGETFGRWGLKQKKGRTYESAGAKVIELASMQLSPDYANTSRVDFNFSDTYRGYCESSGRQYFHIGFVNKNRHYRHEKEACTLLKSCANILSFYEGIKSTRDPGKDQQLRNKDQLVMEGLQHKEVRAQLIAADAMRYGFYGPFLTLIKDTDTDVLNVGPFIQESVRFLERISTQSNIASEVCAGDVVLFGGEQRSEKPAGLRIFPDLKDAAILYLQAGCAKAAEGLRNISKEYMEGGAYFSPTPNMQEVLTGMEAHTDRNESTFGQFSQQVRKEPLARLQTINSKVAMRANKTVVAAKSEDLANLSVIYIPTLRHY